MKRHFLPLKQLNTSKLLTSCAALPFFFPLYHTDRDSPVLRHHTSFTLLLSLSLSLSLFSLFFPYLFLCPHPILFPPFSLFLSFSLSLFSPVVEYSYRNNNGAKPGRACSSSSNVVLKPETKRFRVGSCSVYREPHDRNPRHSSSFRWRTRCHFRWWWSWLFFQT